MSDRSMTAPSAGHTRPTHATVPGDIDASGLGSITPGKTYAILCWRGEAGFEFKADDGAVYFAAARDSSHLKGRDWLLTTEPSAEDARKLASHADLIAALEAVVAPGCVGELYSGGEYFRDNDASRAALVAARTAIRAARGEG